MTRGVTEFRELLSSRWMGHEEWSNLMEPYRRELDEDARNFFSQRSGIKLDGPLFRSDFLICALRGGWESEGDPYGMDARVDGDEDGRLLSTPAKKAPGLIAQVLRLAHPIAALEEYGVPEAIEAQREAVLEALRVAPPPKVLIRHVEAYTAVLGFRAERLRAAETALAEEGLAFNHGTKQVERKDPGSRGYGYRRRVFVALARLLRGRELTNDQLLREEIAALLGGWFPREALDPGGGGEIDQALKGGEKAWTPDLLPELA